MRAQLRHLNKTTIIIAAHPLPDAEQACTELWCFPWDTAIQRLRPGKDPFARVFEYLHTALHQQGVLLAPPRLVDGEELPEDHPLSPANIAQMRGSFLDPVTKFLPSKERSAPGFSLRRIFNRHRYMRALVATDPNQAVACCVEYWASRWRSTLEETPGVPEQLAYNGWVGTEIADGADTWRMLAAAPIDAIARSDLSPSAPAQPGRSARRQTSCIMIAPRSCTVTDHPASELWCFDTRVGHRDTPHTEQFIGQCLQDLAQVLQLRGLLLVAPEFIFGADIPKGHFFSFNNVLAIRQAAKKESRRGR